MGFPRHILPAAGLSAQGQCPCCPAQAARSVGRTQGPSLPRRLGAKQFQLLHAAPLTTALGQEGWSSLYRWGNRDTKVFSHLPKVNLAPDPVFSAAALTADPERRETSLSLPGKSVGGRGGKGGLMALAPH